MVKVKKPVAVAKNSEVTTKARVSATEKRKTRRSKSRGKREKLIIKSEGKSDQPPKKFNAAAAAKKDALGKGVVKINSLPHGFYEDQLKGYFTQFGDVTNVKVVRSLETGRSCGVAFVEFAIPEVAQIAAETMNNYLLFKSLLKTEYIPPSQVKPGLFTKKVEVVINADGTQSVQSEVISRRKKEVRKFNKKPTEKQIQLRQAKFEAKIAKKTRYLESIGAKIPVMVAPSVEKLAACSSLREMKKLKVIKVKTPKEEKAGEAKEEKEVKKEPKKKLEKPTKKGRQSKAVVASPNQKEGSSKLKDKQAKRAAWLAEHKAKKQELKKTAMKQKLSEKRKLEKEEQKKSEGAEGEQIKEAPVAAKKAEKKAPVAAKKAAAKNKKEVVAKAEVVKAVPEKKGKKATAAAEKPTVASPASPAPKKTAKKAPVKAPTIAKVGSPVAAKKGKVEKKTKVQAKEKKASPVKKSIEKKKPLKLNTKKSVK